MPHTHVRTAGSALPRQRRRACGGYTLLIHYPQGTEWVDLPLRMEDYDRPDEREFTAIAAALASRGLTRTTGWQIDTYGRLCAPIAVIDSAEAGQ